MTTVFSSSGEFQISPEGDIVECVSEDIESDRFIFSVRKFNVSEWKKYYNKEELSDTIDILDIGYWYDGVPTQESTWEYEEPCKEWREEFGNEK